MNFNRNDENYIYEVIGRNVKKYRKKKGLTQRQLANRINYSLSFVAGLESKKHQTFSLGALYRISLILGVDIYKFCIDDTVVVKKKKYITYRCNRCGLKEDIPYDLINAVSSINKLYTNQVIYPNFKCYDCDGTLVPETKDEYVLN